MSRLPFLLVVGLLSFTVLKGQAGFKFNDVSRGVLSWHPDRDDSLKVTMSVDFRSWCCEWSNYGEPYRLAVFDSKPHLALVGGHQSRLSTYLNGPIQWREGGCKAFFRPGEWSPQHLKTTTNGLVFGDLELTFRKDVISALDPGKHHFKFWLAGIDVEDIVYFDTTEVSVEINIPATVRISGLKDLDLHYKDVSGRGLWRETNFCVFASQGGEYRITFDGGNNPGGDFYLKSATGNRLPYHVSFHDKQHKWVVSNKSGPLSQKFRGNPIIDCGGVNDATLRVEVYTSNLYKVPTDTYADTLTITVSAH